MFSEKDICMIKFFSRHSWGNVCYFMERKQEKKGGLDSVVGF